MPGCNAATTSRSSWRIIRGCSKIEGAAERTGLYYTLVNAYLSPDEVAYIVNNSRSRLFFSSVPSAQVAEAAAAPARTWNGF